METLNYRFEQGRRSLSAEPRIVGVVSSGNLEVLIESTPLGGANGSSLKDWPVWLLTAASAIIVWRTRIHLLWLLGAGALLGWYGLV